MNTHIRDVFLSHASSDKEEFIRPFASILQEREVSYWLDEAEILWGHSVLDLISQGLEQSRFVLFFLSDSFLSRPWPEAELRTALSKEISSGEVRVLPIFMTDSESVLSKHPFLRDKKWLTLEEGLESIVVQLESLLGRGFRSNWVVEHPPEFRGQVWIKILPRMENIGKKHIFKIKWGRWEYQHHIDFPDRSARIIDMKKIAEQNSFPLHVSIDPPAFVSFGRGNPVKNIDFSPHWKCIDRKGIIPATVQKLFQWFLPETQTNSNQSVDPTRKTPVD